MERFVVVRNRGEVSVLDVDNDVTDENLQLFCVDFEDNEEVASYLVDELDGIVRYLNEQDRLIKEKDGILNHL